MPKRPRPRPTGRPVAPRNDRRPSAHARGYGHDWTQLVEQTDTAENAVCEHCWHLRGVAVPTQARDHVIPFAGITDPLRLDTANLRPLCRSCHTRKTQRFDKRIRAYFDKLIGDGMQYERARDATIERFRLPAEGEA